MKITLSLLLILVFFIAGCKNQSQPITFAVLTDFNGSLAPCGCTSKPLGGLDRIVQKTADLKADLLIVGDTFYNKEQPVLDAQAIQKSQMLADIFQRMPVLAMALGQHDTLENQTTLPILKANAEASDNYRKVDTLLKTIQGFKVGIVGGSYTLMKPQDVTIAAMALRAQGAEFVIALLPFDAAFAQTFIQETDRIDVAIVLGVQTPRIVQKTLLISAGEQGQYLGVLKLYPKKDKTFVYDDEGLKTRQRLERLQQEILTLPDGEAKTARQKDIQKLLALPKLEPKTSYVRYEQIPMTQDLKADKKTTEMLQKLNQELCTQQESVEICETSEEHFVGTKVCQNCHGEAHAMYLQTKHAKAFATLEQVGKQCDKSCIGCHTVGFKQAGGFCNLKEIESYKNVGCENCHGKGETHVQNIGNKKAWSANFITQPKENVCLECHNKTHSDQFNFSTYLPKTLGPGHGLSAKQ